MTSWLTACVSVPHLLVDIARLQRSSARPLAVAAAHSDRAPVIDRCERAAEAGIEIGMPVLTARRSCRELEIVVPDQAALTQLSAQVATILSEQAEDVHRTGVNRWTARAVALGHGYRAAVPLAEQIRADIAALGLQCQVGLARTLTVASIAAQIARSTQVVLPDMEAAFLAPLPVGLLPGVGVRTRDALNGIGITTIGQLQTLSAFALAQVCGPRGRTLARLARGLDAGDWRAEAPTISARWLALDEPEADVRLLHARLHALIAQAGRDLREQERAAGEVTVRIVWSDGSHSQRTERDPARRDLDRSLGALSNHVLETLLRERRLAVRGFVLTLGDLGPRQVDLLAARDERPWHLQQALDHLARRYGPQTVLPGTLVGVLPAAV
jgi:nucleotidyltransferase/DNA polymerase involved in DNA repair